MEVIYVDETNLGGAIDVIDLDSMAQHIYFGPQAEILQRLNDFNWSNSTNLTVTKTFRWSPGTYDKVKELMIRKIGFNKRANGMYSYLSRDEWWWEGGRRSIQSQLRDMDRIITNLRYNGISWMENIDELKEKKELFKNHVSE